MEQYIANNNQQSTILDNNLVNFITTETCSPEAWFIMVFYGGIIPYIYG